MDRSMRSLMGLNGASTSRVLNLATVERIHGHEPEYRADPLFKSNVINSSILLKHKLRSDEDYLFGKGKTTATKIILPFDKDDLKSGGRSMFVDQPGFVENLFAIGGYSTREGNCDRDVAVLRLIDKLPSLDPFILREYLVRHEFKVAGCYFNISSSDQAKMKEFVTGQVRRLSQLATGGSGGSDDLATPRLAMSLLSNAIDQRLEPLRKAFGLEEAEFREGAFAWRGFLYYKWRMEALIADTKRIVKQLAQIRPLGPMTSDQRQSIKEAKAEVATGAYAVIDEVKAAIARYDSVYDSLVTDHDPKAFCQFLLSAPPLFLQLGEGIGSVEHVASYWTYRFPENMPLAAEANELEEIFSDFIIGFPRRNDLTLRAAS
jgi:hypothetical protein